MVRPALPAAVAPAAASAERVNLFQPWAGKRARITMQIQNQEVKKSLIQRLRRIEGQVHGVQAMVENERDCKEVMQQLSAVRSAVQSVSRAFLQEYATTCLFDIEENEQAGELAQNREKREKIVQDMIDLLDKAP